LKVVDSKHQRCIIAKKKPMRIFVFVILVCCISCTGGGTSGKTSAIDTAKLFNPMPDTGFTNPFDWFKNAVALKAGYYILSANDVQKQAGNVKDLCGVLKLYAGEIRKRKFYLLCDSTVAFSEILVTIDCLKENDISNYKVVKMDTVLKMPPLIHIQSPVHSSKKYAANDSANFVVSILAKGMEVKHMGRSVRIYNLNELDELIKQYQQSIDSSRGFIRAEGNTNINRIMPVMKLLKKRGFSGIQLVTIE
jgi:biopolymer transport protein ExbD